VKRPGRRTPAPGSAHETVAPGGDEMDPSEVKRRATAGAVLIAIRTATTQMLALAGNIVLTHLLVPGDFGAVALGSTLVTIAGFLSDGGMGVAMIRRGADPSLDDLRALLGFQLATSGALAATAIVVGSFFGRVGLITATMALSLPFLAARAPASIVLERRLLYRPVVFAEFFESLTFYLWSIPAVLAGLGVWGLASGTVVRAVVGTLLLTHLSPVGWIGARFDLGRLRSLLGFGARFQARGLVALGRDEGLNLGIVAVAGLSMLGLWSLAARVMQIPFLVFSTLLRVSYPAMARLNRAGEDLGATVDNLASMTSLLAVAVLAPLSGVADQLIPAVFGQKWAPAADIIPWASAGLMVGGPISVACSGYLYATNDSRTPLRATALNAAVWLTVSLGTLRALGPSAVGIGWLFASLTEALIFSRAVRSRSTARIWPGCVLPWCLAVPTALAGRAAETAVGGDLAGAIVGALFAGVIYTGFVLLFARHRLKLLAAAVRGARKPATEPTVGVIGG
jgi:O-antigen/teichoic acid export membrane protein